MKTSGEGFQQCHNAPMALDGEHQIIVATQVGPQVNDQGQLVGFLDGINETFGACQTHWLRGAQCPSTAHETRIPCVPPTISKTTVTVAEDGRTDSYTVVSDSQPSGSAWYHERLNDRKLGVANKFG